MKNVITICKNCINCEKYKNPNISFSYTKITGNCLSKDAPITNFVTGEKKCSKINTDAKCKYYEKMN